MNVPPQKPQGRTFVVVQLNIRYEKELGKEKALLISLMNMLVQAIISSFLRSFSHFNKYNTQISVQLLEIFNNVTITSMMK